MDPVQKQRNSSGDANELARSEPFPAGTTIARYRLVSLIGSGAMGDVYRAHDRALDREVALKVLPPELTGDRERVHRFAHEARATSALSHPHIVAIHEVGHARPVLSVRAIGERPSRAGEVHYISMELIDGATLRETLASASPLRQRIELLAQVADGLAKAHAANILHRDLKPDNILVSRDGYAKIVDFGLAKLIDTTWNPIGADSPTLRALTAHGELLGTPGYMAPEQVVGKPLDARADIFSFGCILYEAIAGTRAFEAESFVDTLYKIVHEEAAPLTDAPPELQRIVERCLAKNRDDRYQSIRDVANDLRAWSTGGSPAVALAARRRFTSPLLIAALIACVPILAFILLRDKPQRVVEPAVRRVTSDGRALFAAISPDGRYVAYVTSEAKGQALWLEQLTTGRTLAVVPISDGHYAGVTFSRDGEQLFFTRYDGGPLGQLYRVSILGGDPQKIVHDIDTRAAFSPDGTHIAFGRDDYNRGTTSLIVANADGTNERVLAMLRLPDRLTAPAWSPDGRWIAVAQRSALRAVSFPGGKVRTIETNAHLDTFRGVAWPENDRIVAAAATDESAGRYSLWNIDPSNGEARAITNDLTELYAPVISDDGVIAAMQVIREANLFELAGDRVQQLTSGIGAANGMSGVAWIGDRIVYASAADGKPDLWIRNASDPNPVRLTDDAAFEAAPRVTPDGTAILYLSSSSARHTIWSVRPGGSDRRQLTNGPRDGAFAISPDSQRLAWASLDPKTNEWGLWTMPLAGGPKQRIAKSASVLEDIRYTPDGKSIIFTGYERTMLLLYRVSASGGVPKPLTDKRSRDASISPDGSTIACMYGNPDRMRAPLGLIDVASGKLTKMNLEGSMYRWHPNGRAITFVRGDNLWLQPIDGGAPRRLTQFSDGVIYDYAWTTDGKRAVLAHVVDSADVVLMR